VTLGVVVAATTVDWIRTRPLKGVGGGRSSWREYIDAIIRKNRVCRWMGTMIAILLTTMTDIKRSGEMEGAGHKDGDSTTDTASGNRGGGLGKVVKKYIIITVYISAIFTFINLI